MISNQVFPSHDPEPSFDSRFWWDANTPKELEDQPWVDENGNPIIDNFTGVQGVTLGLKSQEKLRIKQAAASLLQSTDWMVVRQAETNKKMNSEVATYRAAIRDASDSIEAAIDAATTHAEFMALFDVPLNSDGIPSGNAPIDNWPERIIL